MARLLLKARSNWLRSHHGRRCAAAGKTAPLRLLKEDLRVTRNSEIQKSKRGAAAGASAVCFPFFSLMYREILVFIRRLHQGWRSTKWCRMASTPHRSWGGLRKAMWISESAMCKWCALAACACHRYVILRASTRQAGVVFASFLCGVCDRAGKQEERLWKRVLAPASLYLDWFEPFRSSQTREGPTASYILQSAEISKNKQTHKFDRQCLTTTVYGRGCLVIVADGRLCMIKGQNLSVIMCNCSSLAMVLVAFS